MWFARCRSVLRSSFSLLIALLLAVPAVPTAPPPATPGTATLGLTSGPVQWDGFAGTGVSPANEDTCIEGTNCDTFVLKLAPGNYVGKRIRVRITWGNSENDYDMYVHAGNNDGATATSSTQGSPGVSEENVFEIDTNVGEGVNDTYTVRTVYWAVTTPDPYHGEASVEDIPVTGFRSASYVKGEKSGIKFSRNRTVYAPAAAQDVEPSARVDFTGNAYVGAIRGLTGGNDLWRFDLNPNSPTYDPFLTQATAIFDSNGIATNPAWLGQPDALSPDNDSDLGGDGGGDLDIAVGFQPPAGAPPGTPPIVATTSLVAANVSSQRSTDGGETFTNNPAGNTTVPVDDRQWNEFLGGNVVYLGYRELVGLQATAKFYVNRSDDGGLTYGPALLAGLGGNLVGNIDVDQRDGTVYFCYQGPGADNNKVKISVGQPLNLSVPPVTYSEFFAATAQNSIGFIFPACKVADDGTVYVVYSDGGRRIYLVHSLDQGRTWSLPARVSDTGPSAAVFPWLETGKQPGSVAVVWYGAEAADSEDGLGLNNDNANWKVFFSQTLNATSANPVFYQTVASDHFIHGSNISILGLQVTGDAPNRNLADFFQVALDPQGLALIAYADDSNDFSGHTYVTHQTHGFNLHTGKRVKTRGKDPATAAVAGAPEVSDFRQDARLEARPPQHPAIDSPADIISIDYRCEPGGSGTFLVATMRLSALTLVPPNAFWRINFASNPTRPGLSDRADQWFLLAETDALGNRSFFYGTAVRETSGAITYTKRGIADSANFDFVNSSLTIKVDFAKLNALATRGPVTTSTRFIGLRGSSSINNFVIAGLAGTGLTDRTRGGGSFTCGQ